MNRMEKANFCKKLEKNYCDFLKVVIFNYEPLLFDAVTFNYVVVIKMLLKLNFDVNIKNSNGSTPLMIAASTNNYEIAEILLKAGADPNIENSYGKTALIYSYEDSEMRKLLIEYGANEIEI